MSTTNDAEARIDQSAQAVRAGVDRTRPAVSVRWYCDGPNKPPKMARPARLLRLILASCALFAQRADIGGEIGRLVPAQRKIRHLRVRVEQEEGNLFRGEIRLACDGGKRGSVRISPTCAESRVGFRQINNLAEKSS